MPRSIQTAFDRMLVPDMLMYRTVLLLILAPDLRLMTLGQRLNRLKGGDTSFPLNMLVKIASASRVALS